MNGSLPPDCALSAVDAADMRPEGLAAVTLVVCSSCRLAGGDDAGPRPGALLARSVAQAGDGAGLRIAQVACLANCKRSLSAALLRDGGWSYVFGDLTPDSAPDLVAGARLLQAAPDGILPWRGRPDSLKRGLVSRTPPVSSLEEIVP